MQVPNDVAKLITDAQEATEDARRRLTGAREPYVLSACIGVCSLGNQV